MSTRYVRKERVSILPILIEFQSEIRLRLHTSYTRRGTRFYSMFLLSFQLVFSMSTRYDKEGRVSILPILIEFQSGIRLILDPNCNLDISEYELERQVGISVRVGSNI